MSTAIFPTLIGKGYQVVREPEWSNQLQVSASGKDTSIAYWSYPRWRWTIPYDILRSDSVNLELQNLAGFFNLRTGSFDTFLYTDPDDYAIVGQTIGTGDGATVAFQLIRTWGSFNEPILAPHAVSAVYIGSSAVSSSKWAVTSWGSTAPGVVTFTPGNAPSSGLAVKADFTYYFPVRFMEDIMSFDNFMNQMWSNKSVKFRSVK